MLYLFILLAGVALFCQGTVPSAPKTLQQSFISHMWRKLSGAFMLLEYPTNQQSFCNSWEDENACWISSRACWCLFSYTHLSEQFRADNRTLAFAVTGTGQRARPFWGATAGPDASTLSVCLSDMGVVCSAPSAGGSTTFFSRREKTKVRFACRYSKKTDAQSPFEWLNVHVCKYKHV